MQYQWDSECRALVRPGERQSAIIQARQCYFAPERFTRDSFAAQLWLDCFQNTLHLLLEGYFNGAGLGVSDRLLTRPMIRPNGRIKELLDCAWHLAIQKLGIPAPRNAGQKTLSVAAQLTELYQILDQQLATKETNEPEVLVKPCQANPSVEPREVTSIRRFASEPLRQLGSDLLVQGSVATDEQIGYSDLDLWLVVSRQALAEAGRLQDLARLVFRIQRRLFDFDPLQHHGVMLATQIDLCSYPESFLPLEALAKARYLCPENGSGLVARPRDSAIEAGMAFFNLLALFRQSAQQQREYREAFGVKNILSHIMLLPAFFEGSQGRPCFKRDSFERVQKVVPAEIWSIMTEVSEVRQTWRYQPSLIRRATQASLRNAFVFQYLMRNGLSGKFGKVVKCQLPSQWQARTLLLAETLWEKICTSSTT